MRDELHDHHRDRDIDEPVQRVDHVVLAEVDDRQQYGCAPGDEPDRERAVSRPCISRGQRRERGVQRWEGRELVRVEAVVDLGDEVLALPQRLHRLVVDLHDLVRKLVPGRSTWIEKVGGEGEKGHEQEGRHEPPEMLAAVDPEVEPDHDRQREVHEVEEHRDHVLPADDAGVIEGVLQNQRRDGAAEDQALQA